MADLDDFFAKKDRKKSKAVKKFATTDELSKKMDDPKQKSDVRPKKERPAQDNEEGGRAGEEEEWKEYEETVKDYTGLKIQVLQGGNNGQESGRDPASEDCAQDGSGKPKGPWKKTQVDAEAAPAPVVEEPPPPAPRETRAAAYVPPTLRIRPEMPRRPQQSRHAPDIHSDDSFPVLGAASTKRGGWSTAPASAAPAPPQRHALALNNRYTQLQDDS